MGCSLPVSTARFFWFFWFSADCVHPRPQPHIHTPYLSNAYILSVSILGKFTSANGHCFGFHTCVFNISQHPFATFKAKLEISIKNLLLPQSFPSWSMVISFFQVFRAVLAHLNPSHPSSVNMQSSMNPVSSTFILNHHYRRSHHISKGLACLLTVVYYLHSFPPPVSSLYNNQSCLLKTKRITSFWQKLPVVSCRE